MHYSFSSVYMAFLTSNILLIVISLCLRSKKIMVNVGYKLLALLMGFTFLRFLFPFELSFTTYLKLPPLFSKILQTIQYPFYFIGSYGVSLWTFLEIAWIVGIVVNLFRDYRIRSLTSIMVSCGQDVTDEDPYASALERVCAAKHKKNVFRIVKLNGLQSPMLYGLFSPRILLPRDLVLSEEDLYYTLSHEVSHHYHHDLVLKNIVNLMIILYWWNPAGYGLKKRLDLIVEMRIDDDLTTADSQTAKEYLRCLLHIKEYILSRENIPVQTTLSLLKDDENDLTKRFDMMLGRKKHKIRSLNVLITALVMGLFVGSYLFIFEAFYSSNEMRETMMILSPNNTYAIDNGDGTYDTYINGDFLETTDTLEFYPQDIPIY